MTPLRIYIIEDSLLIRNSLIATLEEFVPTQVVGVAEDEIQAIDWLNQFEDQCDLLIIDLFLKAGSGLGVLRWIGFRVKSYKVVVLSNYATEDTRRKSLALGADRVFDKSNEIEALISYVRSLV